MKKKVLAIALAVALIAIMVSGSLAYFTANDEVTNTFTIGSVMIEIWENGKVTDTDKVVFEKPLVPVVSTQNVSDDPGYEAKVVKVQNTGVSDAYIRTHIAVPTALVDYLQLDIDATGWNQCADSQAEVDGVQYTVYTYDYSAAVTAGNYTSELLKGVYLGSDVDLKDDPSTATGDLVFCKADGNGGYIYSDFAAHSKTNDGYESNTLQILVASQAIQAQGFDGNATNALNTGFPQNPWA